MPTYAYRGNQCGHEFEIRQSFSDDPITECLTCGKPVRRVIHPAGIVFKGTGWYLTDSRPTTETSGGVHDASKVSGKTGDASAPSTGETGSTPATPAATTATRES
jgi:putative FmdB family regulatory protein